MMNSLYYIGIDIAKAKFDLAFIKNNQKFHHIFDYSKKGFKAHSVFLKEKEIKTNKNFHDRFLIIDNKDIYLISTSLKDLGKKVLGFSLLKDIDVNFYNHKYCRDKACLILFIFN